MRHEAPGAAVGKSAEISRRVLSPEFQVTPSMRRKVEDLAVWLAAGDRRKVRGAARAVIGLLCAAARAPGGFVRVK